MQVSISFSNWVLRIALVWLLALSACSRDKNKFSPIPFIELKGAYVYNNGVDKDSFILLQTHYRDGDGNVGLNPGDTLPPFNFGQPYYYNMLVWMYVKDKGQWIKPLNPLSPDKDTLNFHERLPSLTPTGRAKWIEGNLDLRIPAEPYSLKPDTVKLVLQMFDRSLNKSNTIETEPIILKH